MSSSPPKSPRKKIPSKKRKKPTDLDKNKRLKILTEEQVLKPVVKSIQKASSIDSSFGLPSPQMPDLSRLMTRRDLRAPLDAHLAKRSGRTLDSPELLMKTGPLAELLPKHEKQWSAIAQTLSDVFLNYIKTEREEAPSRGEDPRLDYAELCTIYYANGEKKPQVKGLGDAERLNKESPGQLDIIVGFLEKFMGENGQWDYIENQEWFLSGKWAIGIDVNYYPDRSEFTGFPGFHKDSGGNNIFVNLIFDNKVPIEATEWFPDLAQPSKARREWQKTLLPESHLAALDLASDALRTKFSDSGNVYGDVSEGRNTYLSWVDDLVWHSTPSPTKRTPYTAKEAIDEYVSLGDYLSTGHPDNPETMRALEIIGTIADSPDTDLYKWLDAQDLGPQDLSLELAERAWTALYMSPDGSREKFEKDATTRGTLRNWLLTGAPSEANAQDDRLKAKNSKSIIETPVGLSKRRRANSLDEAAIRKLRKTNEKPPPRSFIRTWIRILSKEGAQQEKDAPIVV